MEKEKIKINTGKKNAFTLIELVIVIAILGILSTISYIGFSKNIKNVRDSNRIETFVSLKSGLGLYELQAGKYPVPENIYSSGKINNDIIIYVGEVGDQISRLLKLNSTPKDPLSKNNYIYGVTSDYKEYQLGSILESNQEMGLNIVSQTYADDIFKARVIGNYKNYIKYQTGSQIYAYNIPSLIISNTGTVNLISTGTYYVVNKIENLPYNIKGEKTPDIKKFDGNQIIQELTKDKTTSLTGMIITNLTADNFEQYFTGEILKSFNITGKDITSQSGLKALQEALKIQITGKQSQALQDNTKSCSSITNNGYTIPILTHNQSQTISKGLSGFGTGTIQATCNNGVLSYGTENISCITNYVVNSGTCVQDVCTGSAPSYSQANGTQKYGSGWTYNTIGGICTFICQAGYYWNGSSCVGASVGYYVPTAGLATQTACTTGYYQDTVGQSSCKSCTANPSNSTYVSSTGLTTNSCTWNCISNYYSSSGSCLAFVNGSCTGLPTYGQYYNTSSNYTLSGALNGTSLTASYSATPTLNTCQFKCNSGYTYNSSNNTCVANSQNTTCSGTIPSNATASTANTYTQTWNGTAYTPTSSWTYGGSSCGYTCNSGYVWSGSSCNVNYLSSYNCGSPGAMRTGDTYTCNFNGIVNVSTFKANFGCNDGETGNYTITFSDGSTVNFNGGCGTVVNIGNKSSSYVKLYMNSGGGGDNQISLETRGVNL